MNEQMFNLSLSDQVFEDTWNEIIVNWNEINRLQDRA